jgi:FkbM family methyltransferase
MTHEPGTGASSAAATKEVVLLSRDLAMLATASKYNLDDKSELERSMRDLSRLFFHLANIVEVDLFVEAGAKDAASSRRARRLLKLDRVVAFEANPYTHARFAPANADPNAAVEYRHLALSDEPGTVTFNVLRAADGSPRADGQASLLKRENELEKGFVEVTVDATTIDTFFADQPFERAAFWVDVEGAARAVLSGGQASLEKAAIVMIEVEDRRYWGEQQWLRSDVVSYLYDRGLVPVARDFQSRYQYNIVFVRTDLLDNDRVRWGLTLFSSRVGEPADMAASAASAASAAGAAPGAGAGHAGQSAAELAKELSRRAVSRGKREVRRIRSSR